ncbi:hypothetical protein I317_03947 [Kwoniella heveanensis CBS 569]|nr:hypothetical protein I317_03947 [Kwoniella heveanensis CBS 569]
MDLSLGFYVTISPPPQDVSLQYAIQGLSLRSKDRDRSTVPAKSHVSALSDRPSSPTFSTYAPSSSASASSTEINDQLTPLPTGYGSQDRPPLVRKSSLPPNLYQSPTLLSLSELMSSPPIPDNSSESSQSYFPPYSNQIVSSLAGNGESSYSPSAPRTPSDHGSPPKAASDSGTFISARRLNKSPRIRNIDSVLAPHGSFTSARARSSTISSRSSTVGSSRSGPTSSPGARSNAQDTLTEMDHKERERLFKAASKGDQLAMHRLGWRPPKMNHRHTLGATGDVWGAGLS